MNNKNVLKANIKMYRYNLYLYDNIINETLKIGRRLYFGIFSFYLITLVMDKKVAWVN